MQKIVNLFKLKPGISVEEYMKWSREVDQKTVRQQKGVSKFEVFVVKGSNTNEPYQILEVMEAESFEVWQKILETDVMKNVLKQWDKLADGSSVITYYGE